MRIFAGPNGSGKSTIFNFVKVNGIDMGVYVNADDIKKELNDNGSINLQNYNITTSEKEIKDAIKQSTIFANTQHQEISDSMTLKYSLLCCNNCNLSDYLSTFIAEFIRYKLLESSQKFTFETVMSHRSKIDFIKKAQLSGYKTYLYFISLEDPELNKGRVNARVLMHGHDVPFEKIESRYFKSMELLIEAVKNVDKAFFFDNSNSCPELFARYENGDIIIDMPNQVPQWFYTYLLNKIKTF